MDLWLDILESNFHKVGEKITALDDGSGDQTSPIFYFMIQIKHKRPRRVALAPDQQH